MEDKLYNEIKQLIFKGMSFKDIAVETDLSESIIRRVAYNLEKEKKERRGQCNN
jgi:DNA-binding NarL/FixJ family response regulator